eukprot:1849509-Prymnesium_polylepis.1
MRRLGRVSARPPALLHRCPPRARARRVQLGPRVPVLALGGHLHRPLLGRAARRLTLGLLRQLETLGDRRQIG